MPIFDDTMNSRTLAGGHYGYSATRIDQLGASEYTLVGIAADDSGSVATFRRQIEACMQEVVKACLRAPRAHNLMLRTVTFDGSLNETHGFKPLPACSPADYDGCLGNGGMTALYDASHNLVASVTDYGRDLTESGFTANGLVFVLTDGWDTASTLTAASVREAVQQAVTGEAVESMVTILVGVNVRDARVAQFLMDFSTQAGFTHYIELDDANADTFARLADFVTRSITAQSIALGTGSASSILSF